MLFISQIQKFYIVTFFCRFQFFSQPLGNLFLTVETIFNWNFHSIANSTLQTFLAKYLRKKCSDPNEVASDNEDDKDDCDDDDDDDDEDISKDAKVVAFGPGEVLTMLDR